MAKEKWMGWMKPGYRDMPLKTAKFLIFIRPEGIKYHKVPVIGLRVGWEMEEVVPVKIGCYYSAKPYAEELAKYLHMEDFKEKVSTNARITIEGEAPIKYWLRFWRGSLRPKLAGESLSSDASRPRWPLLMEAERVSGFRRLMG